MDIEFTDVAESQFGNDATDGKEEIVTCTLRYAGETDGQDELAAEVWCQYGFTSRPAAPSDSGKCQALTVDAAGKRIVVGSRDLRGADSHGALNAGDVAMWSTGKNSIRCNADGSIAIHQIGESIDSGLSIEKDGTILIFNEWGTIELGKDGFKVLTASGTSSLELAPDHFQAMAPQGFLRCGCVGLGLAPSLPLCTGAGAAAVPIPYILG